MTSSLINNMPYVILLYRDRRISPSFSWHIQITSLHVNKFLELNSIYDGDTLRDWNDESSRNSIEFFSIWTPLPSTSPWLLYVRDRNYLDSLFLFVSMSFLSWQEVNSGSMITWQKLHTRKQKKHWIESRKLQLFPFL